MARDRKGPMRVVEHSPIATLQVIRSEIARVMRVNPIKMEGSASEIAGELQESLTHIDGLAKLALAFPAEPIGAFHEPQRDGGPRDLIIGQLVHAARDNDDLRVLQKVMRRAWADFQPTLPRD